MAVTQVYSAEFRAPYERDYLRAHGITYGSYVRPNEDGTPAFTVKIGDADNPKALKHAAMQQLKLADRVIDTTHWVLWHVLASLLFDAGVVPTQGDYFVDLNNTTFVVQHWDLVVYETRYRLWCIPEYLQ